MSLLHVLVVDDEMDSRKRLVNLIRRTDGLTLHGDCADGRDAIECILQDAPDLVLLAVEMPEVTGLDVVRTLGPDRMPPFIFVAAHDEHAVMAFEVGATDYLLKPFDEKRFADAVCRARTRIRYRSLDRLSSRMLDVLQATGEAADLSTAHSAGDGAAPSAPGCAPALAPDADSDGSPGRIAVQRSGVTELVPIKDVHFFEADGSYVKVHTKAHTYLIRERMKRLDARLPERHFCRIHRSTIVRLSDVEALEPTEQGDVAVRLSDGTRLRVSRGRRETLEDRLGLL